MNIVKLGARASVSVLALAAMTPAVAQSTGQQDFDQQAIVVTGGKLNQGVAGINIPATSRAKETITKDLIQRETPGQSILDTINSLPGVSFQNNDAYGASGGTLNIRGFDASRIALTLDGLALNDTGNYALYSGQQLDPELIDQVTVSLGSADVDAPSAAASGSTVNYTTRNPTKDFHVQLEGSIGQFDELRIFGVVDTGTFTSFGTRAFLSASKQTYNNPFNDIGKLNKSVANFKIYQPIGDDGDFFSVAGNYDQNRNDFFGSAPLRTDLTISPVNATPRTVGTGSTNRFPTSADEREYSVARCTTPIGVTGKADAAGTCGSSYDQRYNPSNTGNIRFNSRFTLTPKLVLTVDAGYEYTLANGGGTATANEGFFNAGTAGKPVLLTGYYGGQSYLGGVDLNGDGDNLDKVLVSAPSTTKTNRYLANISLRYSLTPDQIFRLGYSLDYGHHRQTGEITTLKTNGFADGPFPSNHPILDSAGNPIEKRDRLSYAILNQGFGEYRGQFFDQKLIINAGLRAPFFERNLHNYCFVTAANGNVDCTGQNAAENASYAALHPYGGSDTTPTGYATPQHRILRYNKLLPAAGFIFNLTNRISLNANYSKGLQVPGTDNLYQGFYFPEGSDGAKPKPETTDNFDAGVRYKSGKVQAMIDGWYTIFHNRLASSYDPDLDQTVYRNLGTVHKYGVDANVSYQVLPQLSLYGFGSYLKSKILDNNNIASKTFNCAGYTNADALFPMAGNGVTGLSAVAANCAITAGKRESGAPKFTFGGRVQGDFGPLSIGTDIKRTGPRYINDQNLPVLQSYVSGGQTLYYQVYGAKAPAYTLVNLDARFSFTRWGASDKTFVQLNVYNLFNKFYVGGVGGGTTPRTSTVFAQIGVPRTISGTLSFGF